MGCPRYPTVQRSAFTIRQQLNHFTTATPCIYVHVCVKVGFWNKDHQTKAKPEVCFTDIYSKQSMASEFREL